MIGFCSNLVPRVGESLSPAREITAPLCAVAAALPQHPLCSVGLLRFFTKTVSRGTHNELTFSVGDRAMCAREPHTSNRTRAPSTPNRDQATGRFSRVTVDAQAVGDVTAHSITGRRWLLNYRRTDATLCNSVLLPPPPIGILAPSRRPQEDIRRHRCTQLHYRRRKMAVPGDAGRHSASRKPQRVHLRY